jgi:O-acetyl-ADP-ribose deacetylase (regulator of RNase III)
VNATPAEFGDAQRRCDDVDPIVLEGDLLDQDVDAIVNPWNRNLFPWWLLLPQGVSGAIKRRAGLAPFRELRRYGVLPLGGAVVTGAGRLPQRAIIHVAGIGLLWRASARSIQESVRNAVQLAASAGFRSLAFPLIGAGTGGIRPSASLELTLGMLTRVTFDGEIRIVKWKRTQ